MLTRGSGPWRSVLIKPVEKVQIGRISRMASLGKEASEEDKEDKESGRVPLIANKDDRGTRFNH